MELLINTLLELEPTLIVQFCVYMLVAFGLGVFIGASVVKKFHERDNERYQDGIANHDRLTTELEAAQAKITELQAKIQNLNQQIRQLRAFPLRNEGDSNPADDALYDALFGERG